MINTLLANFKALSVREQLLSVLATLALVWVLWDVTIFSAIQSRQKLVNQQLDMADKRIKTLEQSEAELKDLNKSDPNGQRMLVDIQAKLSEMQHHINESKKKFVSPTKMAQALQDMLNQHYEIILEKLESTPAQAFSETLQLQPPIYKHGLELTFKGSYPNIVRYLKALESLPWRFNCDSVDYQVKDYPEAEVVLRLSTLSFEEHWLDL